MSAVFKGRVGAVGQASSAISLEAKAARVAGSISLAEGKQIARDLATAVAWPTLALMVRRPNDIAATGPAHHASFVAKRAALQLGEALSSAEAGVARGSLTDRRTDGRPERARRRRLIFTRSSSSE